MNILITGVAGFIGFLLSNLFLNNNHKVMVLIIYANLTGKNLKKKGLKY